ncbi:MAG: hypothetical protein ACFB0B_15400 [Thermonemataceae bacterium]
MMYLESMPKSEWKFNQFHRYFLAALCLIAPFGSFRLSDVVLERVVNFFGRNGKKHAYEPPTNACHYPNGVCQLKNQHNQMQQLNKGGIDGTI